MSSFLWKHFTLIDNGEAQCRYCPVRYNTKKTTASLRYHLHNKHPDKVQLLTDETKYDCVSQARNDSTYDNNSDDLEAVPESSTNAASSSEAVPRKRPRTSRKAYYTRKNPKSEAVTRAFVKMIAMDMLPLSFGEGTGFLQFLRTVCPNYTMPSRTVVRNRLQGLYDSVQSKIVAVLRTFSSVALTTDAWSSRTAVSYVTVTVHAIDEFWKLRSFTLDTLEMSERHTTENLRDHLSNVITEWDLNGKVAAVVHDNATNMVSAMRCNFELGKSVRCFSHTLQCAVDKALRETRVNDFLHKICAIVGHFKHSNIASKALTHAQHRHKLPEHCLISYCKTRWNSAYAMMQRVLEQREAIETVLSDAEVTTPAIAEKLLLTNPEWSYLRSIVNILKPFDVATKLMSSEAHATISMVRPMIHNVLRKFLRIDERDSTPIQFMKKTLEEELRARFLQDDIMDVSGVSTILDPRYKDMNNETTEYRDRMKLHIAEMMVKENQEQEPAEPSVSKKEQRAKELDFLFDDDTALSQSFEKTVSFYDTQMEKELENFMREATIPRSDDPLIWWNSHRYKFPVLSRIARRYLSIPATSTPSERVFSTAGNVISAKRSCLSPENANLLIFLYQNRDILQE